MKIKIAAFGGSVFAVLPWDDYQSLVVPISHCREIKAEGEIKMGRYIWQLWNARTYFKRTLKKCKTISIRRGKAAKTLGRAFYNHIFGDGTMPMVVSEDPEYLDKEIRKLWMLERRDSFWK